MSELHLASALGTLRGMFAPYENDGVALEPVALSAMLAMLDTAAEEAAALEVLALRHAGRPARAFPDNVVALKPRLRVHAGRGHVADRDGPDGGDAA